MSLFDTIYNTFKKEKNVEIPVSTIDALSIANEVSTMPTISDSDKPTESSTTYPVPETSTFLEQPDVNNTGSNNSESPQEKLRKVSDANPELTPYELYTRTFKREELSDKQSRRMDAQKKMGMLADLALLVGEAFTGSSFPRNSIIGHVNSQQQRIYDEYKTRQKEYDLGAYNALLSTMKLSRDDKAIQEQYDYNRWVQTIKDRQFTDNLQKEADELAYKKAKDERDYKLAADRNNESSRHNKTMEGIAYNRDKSNSNYKKGLLKNRGNKDGSSLDSSKGVFSSVGTNGQITNYRFKNKAEFDATANKALSLMKDIAIKNNEKDDVKNIDALMLQFATPNKMQDVIVYVSQNLDKYPEVKQYIKSQANGGVSNNYGFTPDNINPDDLFD